MDLTAMEEEGRRRTEAIIGAWTDRPTGQTKKLLDNYKEAYNEIEVLLTKAYDKLAGISPDDAGFYNELIKFKRFESLQKQIAAEYTKAARAAGRAQINISQTAMANDYYANMYSVNWHAGEFFTVLDTKAVEVSVLGTDDIWASINRANKAKYAPYLPKHGTLSEVLNANATKDLKKIKDVITQGMRLGTSHAEVSRNLQKVFNTTANNSIRIARTEGNRNLNSGAFANTQAAVDAGIELKREYLATLDTRTRQQSGAMDGQIVDADQPFTFNGWSWFIPGNSGNPAYDINDRCTAIDLVGGEQPESRRGRNPVTGENEVADFSSFDTWMKENDLKFDKSGKIVNK